MNRRPPSPRKPSGRRDSAAARARILDASRRILARDGLEGLTISRIAAEADIYSSAIFYHFGGKEGLWSALVTAILEEANDRAATDILAMPLNEERLRRVVQSYFMIGGPELQSSTFEMAVPAMRTPELRESMARMYRRGMDALADDLGALECPERRESLRLMGQVVLAFTEGLNLQCLMSPEADFDAVIALFQDMLLRTLAPVLPLEEQGRPPEA